MIDLILLIAATVLAVVDLVISKGRAFTAWGLLLVCIVLLLPLLPK